MGIKVTDIPSTRWLHANFGMPWNKKTLLCNRKSNKKLRLGQKHSKKKKDHPKTQRERETERKVSESTETFPNTETAHKLTKQEAEFFQVY